MAFTPYRRLRGSYVPETKIMYCAMLSGVVILPLILFLECHYEYKSMGSLKPVCFWRKDSDMMNNSSIPPAQLGLSPSSSIRHTRSLKNLSPPPFYQHVICNYSFTEHIWMNWTNSNPYKYQLPIWNVSTANETDALCLFEGSRKIVRSYNAEMCTVKVAYQCKQTGLITFNNDYITGTINWRRGRMLVIMNDTVIENHTLPYICTPYYCPLSSTIEPKVNNDTHTYSVHMY
ncbi:uncharacterized protein LOC134585969 [Pelobates fuscus]|uniref:uncharacterized protein LOC134585969 n=1 Tax=Pelobates fuscus TaxID=191477 RepID=UPI002FE4AA87